MTQARGQQATGGDVPNVPGYRIERKLGRGSMGVVYLAEDLHLHRKVALKVLAPTLADDELFRKRFDRESRSAANLDHPSIVPVYAAGEAAGLLYIAMRYVDGGDLRSLLDTCSPLGLERVTSMITSVADALDAAHAQGLIHRDVKPANILINRRNDQEHFYLSDFGITKIVSSGSSLTSTGQIVGTIDYIAPEQIQGKAVDSRADLYALGCVLYQSLTGVVPFPRDETAALMWAHVHDEPPLVSAQRPDLPAQVDRVTAKAMAKHPDDRYATCRELALALRAVANDPASITSVTRSQALPVPPIDSSGPQRVVPAGMTSTYTPPRLPPVRVPETSAPPGRKWWWIPAAVALALVLIGGTTTGVWKYFSSRFPNSAEQQLLNEVPLALTMPQSCVRDAAAEQDTNNVKASVVCTPSNEDVNKAVFTTFTSPQAMNNHYRSAVALVGVGENSGDCRSGADRVEGAYTGEFGHPSGRAVCYQDRGSSFVDWTDEETHTLSQATRVDPDQAKLRAWWTGVVDLKLPTALTAHGTESALPPAAAGPALPGPAPAPYPTPGGDTSQPKTDTGDSGSNGDSGDSGGGADSGNQNPTTTPSTRPPPTRTAPSPPAAITLNGPAPPAPKQQQGGAPVSGSGGCTALADSYYSCTVARAAPAYLPGAEQPRGQLPATRSAFLCQTDGSSYSTGKRGSHWWAWVGSNGNGLWVPTLFLAGARDNAAERGLPICGSAPTTTAKPPPSLRTTVQHPPPTAQPTTTRSHPPTTTQSKKTQPTTENREHR